MSIISGINLENTKYNITLPLLASGFTTTAGSSTSGSYLATKWAVANVNGITTPEDGMTVAVRVPLAGSSGGVLLSIDGGTKYYPIVRNTNTLVTTTYPVGSTIVLIFNSTQTAKPYTSSNTATTVTGCWQIADYDANTKTSSGSSEKADTKLFLVGATSQSSSGVTTYSNKKDYIGTDNCLYSNEKKVITDVGTSGTATDTLSHSDTFTAITGLTKSGADIIPTVTTYTLPASGNTDTKVTAVGNHYTPSKSKTVSASSTTAATWGSTDMVTGIEMDAAGHVTGVTSIQMPANPDTHHTANLITGASSTAKANAAATNGNVYMNLVENSTVRNAHNIVGTGSVTVTSDANGKVTVNGTDTNTTYTFSTGESNGQIKVTPSGGSAQNVSVKGLGTAAYTASTAYATAAQGTLASNALPKSGGTMTGNITMDNSASAQSGEPYIQWATVGSNKPYTGFAHDQSDGTFIICSMEKDTTTNGVKYYRNGLAIGGGSGNLFWKGSKVATAEDMSGLAPLASPTFTGTPKAPTAAAGTNTTQIATTAFVTNAVSKCLPLEGGTLKGDMIVGGGYSLYFNTRSSQPQVTPVPGGGTVTTYPDIEKVLQFEIDHGVEDELGFVRLEDGSIMTPGSHPINGNTQYRGLLLNSLNNNIVGYMQTNIPIHMQRNPIRALADPVYDYDAAHKSYVDTAISSAMSNNSQITYGTTDLVAGTSTLATGTFYFVYE